MNAEEWDLEADVLVVGSGAGGMSAAITAAAAGLETMVLEKTGFFGGSTAISGGVVWVPENQGMADAGAPDEPGSALRYLREILGPRLREDMIAAFLENGPRMVAFFQRETEVQLEPRMHGPDYRPNLDGASLGGRGLDPLVYDGRKLGEWFAKLRPPLPQMTAFDGMMVNRADIDHLLSVWRRWRSFLHGSKILARYASDRLRYPRGTRLLAGNALAARLLRSAVDKGVSLKTNTEVTGLITGNGAVLGAEVELEGQKLRVKARRGVVLASGGCAGNPEMRRQLVPHAADHFSMAPEGNVGQGLAIAQKVGGIVEDSNVANVFFAPVSVFTRPDGKKIQFPHLILDRQKPGLIAVNQQGLRFVNEADSYHDFVLGMYGRKGEQPAIPAYLICDSQFVAKYGIGLVRPAPFPRRQFIKAGYLIEAATLGALAQRLDMPSANFEATIAKANRFAKEGFDPEFGKGESAYNRYLGDPAHQPNPCLGPIEKPPFYAVKVYPGDIGSSRGLRTDTHARVLDRDDRAIPGLYACGNDMNSIMAGTYPAGGITLGPAMTFGFIAGRDLAEA
jgi:succinate dehydrogenase/fumarate reductase flavoprotein subunit